MDNNAIGLFFHEFMKNEQAKTVRNYQELNHYAKKGAILFTGSSLMEQFPVCEYCADAYPGKLVYNRGIGGFTTDDFLKNIDTMLLDLEPSTVFINIGTNDMSERFDGQDWMEHLLGNYETILQMLKHRLPNTKVYMMAFYPVNPYVDAMAAQRMLKVRTKGNLALVNAAMEKMAVKYGYKFIDVNQGLTDENGDLQASYTVEGVHMYASAYHVVFENLKPYLD